VSKVRLHARAPRRRQEDQEAAQGPSRGGAAEAQTTIKAKLKRLKQLKEEPTRPKIKVKFTATDEFGQKATLERKVTLCSRLIRVDREKKICRWHPSQKRCALTARLT
jgi:hypothetical protein